jgi:hypothetical protein
MQNARFMSIFATAVAIQTDASGITEITKGESESIVKHKTIIK